MRKLFIKNNNNHNKEYQTKKQDLFHPCILMESANSIKISNQKHIPKPEVPSLRIIKNQTHSQFKHDNISIQDGYSPGIYSQRTSSQYQPNLNSYMSSKRSIYKSQQKQNYDSQVQIYNKALNQMTYRNDQKELMDFDNRYSRCARQRRLREIIQFLLKSPKNCKFLCKILLIIKQLKISLISNKDHLHFYFMQKGVTDKVEEMLGVNPLYVHDFDEKHDCITHSNQEIIIHNDQNIAVIWCQRFEQRFEWRVCSITCNSVKSVRYCKAFLSIQCPNDLEYLNYSKMAKNKQIKWLLKNAKLQELRIRCSKLTQFNISNNLL